MNNTGGSLLGQLLVERKLISPDQLDMALKQQEQSGGLLGVVLLRLGFINDETLLYSVLAEQMGVKFLHLRDLTIPPDVVRRLPPKFATYFKIIPVAWQDEVLTVATSQPLNVDILDGISLAVPDRVVLVMSGEKDILEAIRKYYGVGAETIDRMMNHPTRLTAPAAQAQQTEDLLDIGSEASIGRFVNQILSEAWRDRATDIHIEPYEKDLKIRYRVDGVLYDTHLPGNIWQFKDAINSRIKIMSNLNIAEKRLPQDGRCKVRLSETELDLRVSFLPTAFGESVVIRVLNSSRLYSMTELGLSTHDHHVLDELLKKPHGIIFLTGPTGSGKTTTLYSCLAQVNREDRKIITIEDPIEYQLKGITQIQINPQVGLSFAAGLRSMLRHDPDIMMVGEVRDLETAEIAIQVALTGHLVFSTLHTNDAASGITRLINMGVEPYLVASSVQCFIAQRLVRRTCARCRTRTEISPEVLAEFGKTPADVKGIEFFRGTGCQACQKTGFLGREAIYELLPLTDEIEHMIMTRAPAADIKAKAVANGMTTLIDDGWAKAVRGSTTPEEIIRVAKEDILG